MTENEVKKNRYNLYWLIGLVLLIVAIAFICIFCYGDSINGDEYFSIGFANNTEDFLFLSQGAIDRYGTDGWIDGKFLHDWLSVQPGEQFSLLQIYRNVRDDVHPPLYFMLLNIISSFFVDKVTLLPGYIINVLSGIVICVFMCLISRKIFCNKWMAFIPPLFWLSSNGAFTTMTYLRMYAPLCALCLLCIYLHIYLMEQQKISKCLFAALCFSTIIGTLTHYYYYIMLFIVSLITVCYLLYKKQIRTFVFYAVSQVIGEAVSLAAYPYVIRHLLFSERGTQVQDNLTNADFANYKNFFASFMDTINQFVYNGKFVWFFVILIVLVLVEGIFFVHNKKINLNTQKEDILCPNHGKRNFIIIILTAIGYFTILFKVSYSSKWLYISPIFTLLSIITVGLLTLVFSKINKKYYIYLSIISLICMLCHNFIVSKGCFESHDWIQNRHEQITEYANQNTDVLFFYSDWNNLYDNEILELMCFNQIYSVDLNDIDQLDLNTIMASRKNNSNNIILYFPESFDNSEQLAETIKQQLNGNKLEMILDSSFKIYYLSYL